MQNIAIQATQTNASVMLCPLIYVGACVESYAKVATKPLAAFGENARMGARFHSK